MIHLGTFWFGNEVSRLLTSNFPRTGLFPLFVTNKHSLIVHPIQSSPFVFSSSWLSLFLMARIFRDCILHPFLPDTIFSVYHHHQFFPDLLVKKYLFWSPFYCIVQAHNQRTLVRRRPWLRSRSLRTWSFKWSVSQCWRRLFNWTLDVSSLNPFPFSFKFRSCISTLYYCIASDTTLSSPMPMPLNYIVKNTSRRKKVPSVSRWTGTGPCRTMTVLKVRPATTSSPVYLYTIVQSKINK